ncbi:hypothetical protein VKT23_000824 [Stygiomarasmius scandens]|uniref:TRAF-like signal transducer n=1 Tax=Marasmiellus scandens TaxID=2682957 RepID=A0ABR1KAL8_9AGAR
MPSTNFNYVDGVNQNLLCCICRMPFTDPFTTRTCGHTFCRDCILQSLDHAFQCPIDRKALTADDLQTANPIIRSLVDELAVECTNQPCSHICQRQLLEQHLRSSCLYVQVPCPNEGCNQIMLRRDAMTHHCEHSLVACDACSTEVKTIELEDHRIQCYTQIMTCESCGLQFQRSEKSSHQNSCPETLVQCPQEVNGCSWKGKRVALHAEHISSCPYQAIAGFFSIYHEKTQDLHDENIYLKRRVESLEAQIRTMELELESARIALGPWFRNSSLYFASSLETSSHLPNPAPHERQRLPIVPSMPPMSPALEDDALAPYFPLQESQPFERPQSLSTIERPAPEHPTRTMNRNSWSLGQGWDAMHTHNVPSSTSRAPKQTVTTVPPLKLNCSLEGSLEGLRESIVSLSTSLEAMGRRSDIALTNETLRLNEELLSLKANMHGLRMQMHAVMMENATGRTDSLLYDHSFPPMPSHRYHYMPNSPPSATKL